MLNPIKEIYKFNQKAGLLDKPYSDFLESSFQIEEALEGFDLTTLHEQIACTIDDSPKQVSRSIMSYINTTEPISDVERLDKACDAIVYAFGSMFKLGLNVHQATRAMNIVMKANNAKLGMPKDEYGKLCKPNGFVGPEPELQLLLDER